MQMLGRLLTLILVLALGAVPFASALAAPVPVQSALMADEMGIAGMDAPAGDCEQCKASPGVMTDCLPACPSMPGLVPQDTLRLSLRTSSYEPLRKQSFSGAKSRPDPYPPRPTVFS